MHMTVQTVFHFSVSISFKNATLYGRYNGDTLFLSLAGKVCESLVRNGLKCYCRTELNTVKSCIYVHISMPGWKRFPK